MIFSFSSPFLSSLFFASLFSPSPLSSLVLSLLFSCLLLLFSCLLLLSLLLSPSPLSFSFFFFSLSSLCLLSLSSFSVCWWCVCVVVCVVVYVFVCGVVWCGVCRVVWHAENPVVVASSAYRKITHVGLSLGPTGSQKVTTGCCPCSSLRKDREQHVPDSSHHSLCLMKLFVFSCFGETLEEPVVRWFDLSFASMKKSITNDLRVSIS